MTRSGPEDDPEGEYSSEADGAGEPWCPKSGAVVYADSPLCPECKESVALGARRSAAMPVWIWIAGVLVLAAIQAGIVGAISGR